MTSSQVEELKAKLHEMALNFVKLYPNDPTLPTMLFDGSPIRTPRQLQAAAGITYAEAVVRMGSSNKSVFSSDAEHAVPVGIGTVLERAGAIAYRRRRKRKKRTEA